MKFKKCQIPGLIICEPKKIKDSRGFFFESFRKNVFESFLQKKIDFCQENVSESKFGVFRGLHFQKQPYAQSKLIKVLDGKILDISVDLRKSSNYYGKSFNIILDNIENKQLFIPKGFAHGFLVLSKSARVLYKVDEYYNPNFEEGLNYNDPKLNIQLGIKENLVITNEKDKNYPKFDSEFFFS